MLLDLFNGDKAVTLELKLKRIAFLKQSMAEYKTLKDELDELKFQVLADMHRAKSDRTQPVAGIFGTIVRKTTPVVTDMEALQDWLESGGFAPSDYLAEPQLDTAKLDAIAKRELELNGEIAPGLEYRTTESLSIRTAKE